MKNKGFTFFEMIMVLVILGVTFSIVFPKWIRMLSKWDLETESKKMLSKIRETQQMAIRDQGSYHIIFDTSAESYAIEKENGSVWTLVEEVELKDGMDLVSASFTAKTLVFDQLGTPSGNNSGTNKATIVLRDADMWNNYLYVYDVTGKTDAY